MNSPSTDNMARPAQWEALDEAFDVTTCDPFCPMLFGLCG
jgi:hypothetical protein